MESEQGVQCSAGASVDRVVGTFELSSGNEDAMVRVAV